MPQVVAKFTCSWTGYTPEVPERTRVSFSTIHTTNRAMFEALCGFAGEVTDRGNTGRVKLAMPYPSTQFTEIETVLALYSIPVQGPSDIRQGLPGILCPHYWRTFSPQEEAAYPFFRIDYARWAVGRYHSRDAEERLTVHPGSTRTDRDFGALEPFLALAFSDALRKRIEAIGPKCGYFREILDTDGASSGLWQLWSDVVMPPCLLPRLNEAGLPVADPNVSGDFHDEGYYPQVFRFDPASVEALGPFDVAVMRERSGPFGKDSDRELILSAAFRRELDCLQVPDLKFNPVALV